MQVSQRCADCGSEVSTPAPDGICPTCLLQLGLDAEQPVRFADSTDLGPLLATWHPAEAVKFHHLGDYELLEEIGRGGMGVVFRARQAGLNRCVALKLILAGRLASPAAVKRFQVEAAAAAGLRHPHIVSIFETGEREGHHFYSMELVESGQPLSALRLPPLGDNAARDPAKRQQAQRRIAEVIAAVARAMDYAHERGVLHRDLKPGNILLDREGQPRLADFGLAKVADDDATQLTQSGAVMGTPAYAAPEQASGRSDTVTKAADIYSLGTILFELLTGRPPFLGDTPVEIWRRVVVDEPPHPRSLHPLADADLATICLKCLEKEPTRRYESARALAEDLERWQRGEPITARPAPVTTQITRWVRRHPAISVAVGATVLILALRPVAMQKLADAREEKRQFVSSVREEKVRELQSLRKEWTKLDVPFVAVSSELRAEIWKTRAVITAPERERERYVVGIYAHENPIETAGQFAPFLAWMEGGLSAARSNRVRLDLRIYKDNRAARQALVHGAVDVVRLGAGPFVSALEEVSAKGESVTVLAKARPGRYEATLFARAGTGITNVAALRGRTLALGAPESTISGLHVPALLGALGWTTNDLRAPFHRSHTESVNLVLRGQFDAGVAKADLFQKSRQRGPGLVALTNLTCVSMPWVARAGLAPGLAGLFRQQLLALRETNILDLLPDNPVDGFELATAEE